MYNAARMMFIHLSPQPMYTYVLEKPPTAVVDPSKPVAELRQLRVQEILKELRVAVDKEWEVHRNDDLSDVWRISAIIDAAAMFQGMDRAVVACEALGFFRKWRLDRATTTGGTRQKELKKLKAVGFFRDVVEKVRGSRQSEPT